MIFPWQVSLLGPKRSDGLALAPKLQDMTSTIADLYSPGFWVYAVYAVYVTQICETD